MLRPSLSLESSTSSSDPSFVVVNEMCSVPITICPAPHNTQHPDPLQLRLSKPALDRSGPSTRPTSGPDLRRHTSSPCCDSQRNRHESPTSGTEQREAPAFAPPSAAKLAVSSLLWMSHAPIFFSKISGGPQSVFGVGWGSKRSNPSGLAHQSECAREQVGRGSWARRAPQAPAGQPCQAWASSGHLPS